MRRLHLVLVCAAPPTTGRFADQVAALLEPNPPRRLAPPPGRDALTVDPAAGSRRRRGGAVIT